MITGFSGYLYRSSMLERGTGVRRLLCERSLHNKKLVYPIEAAIVKEDNLICLAYSICRDHIHMVLVCCDEELPDIVRKIKSVSSRKYNIWRGITNISDSSKENNKSKINEQGSLLPCYELPYENTARGEIQQPSKQRGTSQNHLWAQKFNISYIDTGKKLTSAITYVNNIRMKHNLPEIPEDTRKLVQNMLCDLGAFFKKIAVTTTGD